MNIVFLMPDQLRPDFLGCYGAHFLSTPNIDRLARESIVYDRAISPSPLCVPARASLLTGFDAVRNGVLDNHHWLHPQHFEAGISTWPAMLSAAGFHTEAIGKMHFYPWDIMEGFNHRVIAEDKRHIGVEDDYAEYLARHGLRKLHGTEQEGYVENKGASISPIPIEHQVDVWVGEQATDFIRSRTGRRPFAMMVGFPGPHCPYDPPASNANRHRPVDMPEPLADTDDSARFRAATIQQNKRDWNRSDYTVFERDQKLKIRAHYAALVEIIDGQVGNIVAALKERGLYDDTLIVFCSDHGDFLGDFSLIGKGNFLEPSIRIPMMAKPARGMGAAPRRIAETVILTDVFATIMRAAGLDLPEGVDSVPLPGLWADRGARRDVVFGANHGGCMVEQWPWKYARYSDGSEMLVNLEDDPAERHNRAYDPALRDVRDRLDALLVQRLMTSVLASHGDKKVFTEAHIPGRPTGQRGWRRPYPHSTPQAARHA